jgi:hypothetical protein
MLAALAFLAGVAIVGIVLAFIRAREWDSANSLAEPTALGWATLAFGVTAAAALAVGMFTDSGIGCNLGSIACASAAAIIGLGAVRRQDRCWPTWVGLAAGVIPGTFRAAFAVENILGLGS